MLTTKKTGIIVISVTFLVLVVMDLVSTLSLGNLVQYLEANPVYSYIGLTGIIVINFIIIAVVFLLYKRSSNPMNRFIYINLLVTICITRVFVVINNIKIFLDPPTLQQAVVYAAQQTTATKVAATSKFALIGIVPYFIAIITYWIWSLDHNVEVKRK